MRAHVKQHCRPSTAAGYRALLEKHLLPELGTTPVIGIGRTEVAALHHRLRGKPTRANAAVDLLSQMFALGRGVGDDSARAQPLPRVQALPDKKARAVPERGGIPQAGTRAP